MQTLETFREINRSFPNNSPICKWKTHGKKAIGWLCIYIPEEIIHAAGLLPVRINSDSQELTTNEANVYMPDSTCSYVRSCLDLGLKGEFNALDAIVACTACQGCTRLSELWAYYVKDIPVIYTLDLPRNISEEVVQFYKDEILQFKENIQDRFNVEITDEALKKSIKVYNEGRALLNTLYEQRRMDDPPISGSEAMEVVNASQRMPREDFNQLLRVFLKEIDGRKAYPQRPQTRIILIGSPLNSAEFLGEIEKLGYSVVTDELCSGRKYFSDLVDESPEIDPIDALARRYVFQFPCAREMPKQIRIERILNQAKEYQVQGAISILIRYCTNSVWTQPILSAELQKMGIKNFVLDIDYGTPFTGQIRTRLEAFLETLNEFDRIE